MGSSQQSYLPIEERERSGSELLDSFYRLPSALTCLQDLPVVDMSQVSLEAQRSAPTSTSEEKDGCPLLTTPREVAIMRLNRVLKLDRISITRTAVADAKARC